MSAQQRRVSGTGLRQVPRRKTSQIHQGAQVERSWEQLPRDNRHVSENDDPMDVEVMPQRAVRESAVLNDLVARVGREVELFAEKLDAWKHREILDQNPKPDAALGLIREYAQHAEATVTQLRQIHEADDATYFSENWQAKSVNDQTVGGKLSESEAGNPANQSLQQLRAWRMELGTWRLAQSLLVEDMANANNQRPSNLYAEDLCSEHPNDRFRGDGKSWISFLTQNATARRAYIVLKWLEINAEFTGRDIELIELKLESMSKMSKALFSQGWMKTKAKIKGEKRLRLWDVPIDSNLPEIWNEDRTQLLVTQLDPDAPTRQKRALESGDSDFERSFWVMCWEMLKRGCTMSELQDWCSERGQGVVALSLGASFFQDGQQAGDSDPIARYHWRQACLQSATNSTGSPHERAVYGLLSGDLETVTKVCMSWEDRMYAHYNSLLLTEYNKYVRENSPSSAQLHPLDDTVFHYDKLEQAITRLYTDEARKNGDKGFVGKMRVIQGSLIVQQFPALSLEEAIELSRQEKGSFDYMIPTRFAALTFKGIHTSMPPRITDDHQVLRVFAHLYILYRDIGVDFGEGDRKLATENVIGKYMSFLRLMGKYNIIPLYAGFILRSRAEMSLGVICRDIVDFDERTTLLRLISQGGFDELNVLLNHYNLCEVQFKVDAREEALLEKARLLQRTSDPLWPGKRIITKRAAKLSYEEDDIISSMEWFQALDGHWATSFGTVTRAALRFLCAGHIDAAVSLLSRVSCSELSKSNAPASLGKNVDVFEEDEGDDEGVGDDASPQRTRVYRDMLKQHARVYHELDQFVQALLSLWEWRRAELQHLKLVRSVLSNFSATDSSSSGAQNVNTKEAIERVVAAFGPLLEPSFLQADSSDVDIDLDDGTTEERAQMLWTVRRVYLPEMILAFDSAMHSAAHLCTRDFLLECLDLATKVAANESLTECFTESGRMHELVDAFALNSKEILRLNQKGAKRKKGRLGRSLNIWDVDVEA